MATPAKGSRTTRPKTPPNSTTPGVFDDWQDAFGKSTHPLAGSLGHYVRLGDVREASKRADYLYSDSVFGLLREASGISGITPGSGVEGVEVVVDLRALLHALLLRLAGSNTQGSLHAAERALGSRLSGLDGSRLKGPQSGSRGERTGALSPEVVEVCAFGAFLVPGRGSSQPRVDFDPFVLALITVAAKYADQVADTLKALPSLDPERFRQRVRDELLGVVAEHLEPEVKDRANDVVRWVEKGADWPPLADRQAVEAPDYRPDRPIENAQDDMLEFRDEARATAELICLEQTGPLAIGLFGDWGSGKSSFLKLLECEIDELTSAVSRLKAGDAEAAGPFIASAAHVRFDVWQYNDAQLTLALANETFAQLRRENLRAEVINQLETELRTWDREAGDLRDDISAAEAARETAAADIRSAEANRQTALRRVQGNSLTRLVDALLAGARGAAGDGEKAAAEQLAGDLLETAGPEVGGRRTAGTGLAEDLQVLRNAPATVWWDAGLLGLVAFAIALLFVAIASVPAALSVVTALVSAVLPFWRFVRRVTGVLADHRRQVVDAERQYEAERARAEEALKQAEREVQQKQQSLQARQAKIERFGTGRMDDVYDYFLSEGPLVRRLGEEAGLTSRVRRAFRIIDDLISDRGGDQTASPPGDAAEGVATTAAGGPALPIPERIIFYIDELDRCRAEQVVNMLEVVHLLLAFRNFVVVVGVDSRWLESSLRTVFEKELAENQSDGKRITVHNYIEKIFQVPIQVRGLTYRPPENGDGAGGTYANLVRQLAPAREEETTEAASGGDAGVPEGETGLPRITPLAIELPKPPDPRAAAARAELTPAETAGLLAMGPFVKSSPRTVKRFVNVYRLVRALQTGTAFRDFVEGDPERTRGFPLFEPVQLCLAIQCGMHEEAVWRFSDTLDEAVAGNAGNRKASSGRALFKDFLALWPDAAERAEVAGLLAEVIKAGSERDASLRRLHEAWRTTARFSFWTNRSAEAAHTTGADNGPATKA